MLDMARVHEAFEASTDFTVGIEEEFAILDPHTLSLDHRFEELRQAAQADPVLAESVAGELIRSEIEIRSGRGETFADAIERQREARLRLFRLAAERGARLAATGTHPWSTWQEQQIIDTEHYRRVADGLQYVAWRNNTFSLHVHVGVRGANRAVRVCDRLRPGAARAAGAVGQLAVPGRAALGPAFRPLSDLHEELPALRHPRFLRGLERVRRLRGLPDRQQLDRRADPDLVERAPPPLVRHRRAAHLRRADERRRLDRAGGADHGLRRSGGARRGRGRAVRGSRAAPDRGELLARDPLRARRQADRPAAPRGVPGRERRGAAARLDRPGAGPARDRARPVRGERRAAPVACARGGSLDRGRLRRGGGGGRSAPTRPRR